MKIVELFEAKVPNLPTFVKTDELPSGGMHGETPPMTLDEMIAVFGKPEHGDDKSSVEWGLKFSDGTVASIYDYDDYHEFLTNDEPSTCRKYLKTHKYNYHIGGGMEYEMGGRKGRSRAVELVLAHIMKKWSKFQIIKTALVALKEPGMLAQMGWHSHEISPSDILNAARLAGKNYPEFVAIEKSLGTPKLKD